MKWSNLKQQQQKPSLRRRDLFMTTERERQRQREGETQREKFSWCVFTEPNN